MLDVQGELLEVGRCGSAAAGAAGDLGREIAQPKTLENLLRHPYFVATQAHPEFKSRPTRAHPLFAGLIGAALAQRTDEA